jgi:hypothetical protein
MRKSFKKNEDVVEWRVGREKLDSGRLKFEGGRRTEQHFGGLMKEPIDNNTYK